MALGYPLLIPAVHLFCKVAVGYLLILVLHHCRTVMSSASATMPSQLRSKVTLRNCRVISRYDRVFFTSDKAVRHSGTGGRDADTNRSSRNEETSKRGTARGKYSVNLWDLDSHSVAELRKRPTAPRDDRIFTARV